MITCDSVVIWFPDRENIVINWHYEFQNAKQIEKARANLKKLYNGEVLFTLREAK